MNKVQFFTGSDLPALQDAINEWLSQNEHIQVVRTDLNTVVKPDILGNMQSMELYVFYILYNTMKNKGRRKALALHEVLVTGQMKTVEPQELGTEEQGAQMADVKKNVVKSLPAANKKQGRK